MTPSHPPVRLAAIQLCGYRAFPRPTTIWLSPHDAGGRVVGPGRNLLLYGENGSGKSSLGKALVDLLDLGTFPRPRPSFDQFRYRHENPPREDRRIRLEFDDASVDPLLWTPSQRPDGHPCFADMARSRGWLDYRSIWRITEARDKDHVEVFHALIQEVIGSCPTGTSGETFGQAWRHIRSIAGLRSTSVQHWESIKKLPGGVTAFNAAMEAFVPGLEARANQFLKAFDPWTSLRLTWNSNAVYNSRLHHGKLADGSVELRMVERGGEPMAKPSEFLNEARLTAVGLCLYLAGMALSIPPRRPDGSSFPRILVLDDVLLSLDMSNRRPLLKLLQSGALSGWQVLLLTHDRAWYEIAKQSLPEAQWMRHELFVQHAGNHAEPVAREDADHLMRALDFLHEGQVKAAAVHVRTKVEEVLKRGCHELGLAVPYNPDPRKVRAADLWNAVQGATFDSIRPVERRVDGQGNLVWWQPRPDKRKVVSDEIREEVAHALSWVLNPLSHSESVDRYRREIEEAIFAVDDLEQSIQRAVVLREAGPVPVREMLLTLLHSRSIQHRVS